MDLWIGLALLAGLIWAVNNIIDKFVMDKCVRSAVLPIMALGLFGLISAVVISFCKDLAPLAPFNIFLSLIVGMLGMLATWTYFVALQKEEVSRMIPLYRLTPLFILVLAAFFLGERFTLLNYIGISLILIGAFLLPFRNFKTFQLSKGFGIMVLSAFIWAVCNILMKYLLNFTDFWTIFTYVRGGAFLGSLPLFVFYFKEVREHIKNKAFILAISGGETLNTIALLINTFALSLGPVTIISVLGSVQPFFVLIISVILSLFLPRLLQEEITKQGIALKLASIILLFLGIFLIT